MSAKLQGLMSDMADCRLCKGLPEGPNPIFQLDARARILIAGQAPGRITHAKGRPFDDPSGDRLRGWLGIDKGAFYSDPRIAIFPMGLCFPGGGKGGDKPPPVICAQTWRQRVLNCLEQVELTLVLGAYAIGWHMPDLKGKPVTEAARRAGEGDGRAFILPHPSPRNNRWLKENPWVEADLVPRIRGHVQRILKDPNGD